MKTENSLTMLTFWEVNAKILTHLLSDNIDEMDELVIDKSHK